MQVSEKSLLLHRNSTPRRGGWVAETNSLLNCRIQQWVPGVRIPPSPRKKEDDDKSSFFSGYGAVRLAHLLWEQGVEGSNPFAPTWKSRSYKGLWLPFFGLFRNQDTKRTRFFETSPIAFLYFLVTPLPKRTHFLDYFKKCRPRRDGITQISCSCLLSGANIQLFRFSQPYYN